MHVIAFRVITPSRTASVELVVLADIDRAVRVDAFNPNEST